MSMNPHALTAFPVRRYCRQVQVRITRLLWVHWCCSPLLCIYRSRALEPVDHSINPPSCSTPEWTIGVKGLSPYLFHACTGVPSAHRIRFTLARRLWTVALGYFSLSFCSRPSRVRLAKTGEIGPP